MGGSHKIRITEDAFGGDSLNKNNFLSVLISNKFVNLASDLSLFYRISAIKWAMLKKYFIHNE